MAYIFISSLILFILGVLEYFIHCRNLEKIPTIVHVNGTRGKSTTTRLIAGGLQEAGLKVIAKTTGTSPRLIFEDGSEKSIKRPGKANIIEYLKVVSLAAKRGVDVLVLECMALNPEMQIISQDKMLKADIGVITNVGEDHLEIMGPSLEDVARTLSLTIPRRGKLVTPDGNFNNFFEEKARKKETALTLTEQGTISDDALGAFPYISFKENIANALKVCELINVNREIAFKGMLKARPDPGVSSLMKINRHNFDIIFVNAFAANDKVSTLLTWRAVKEKVSENKIIGIFNSRSDRPSRVFQLLDLIRSGINFEKLVLVGEWSFTLKRVIKGSFPGEIIDLTRTKRVEEILDNLTNLNNSNLLIFGFGNTRGMGEEIIKYFRENGEYLKC